MTQETKFKPILFSTEMVQAILSGRKTQTRRIIKDKILQENPLEVDEEFLKMTVKSKYEIGDVLWVREAFHFEVDSDTGEFIKYGYRADKDWNGALWKPSIHMPKKACRIFLEVTKVRVERLRDLFHLDAIEEGVEYVDGMTRKLYYNYLTLDFGCNELYSFMTLWQKIHGEKSWSDNPFVWAISFKRIEKPLNFLS